MDVEGRPTWHFYKARITPWRLQRRTQDVWYMEPVSGEVPTWMEFRSKQETCLVWRPDDQITNSVFPLWRWLSNQAIEVAGKCSKYNWWNKTPNPKAEHDQDLLRMPTIGLPLKGLESSNSQNLRRPRPHVVYSNIGFDLFNKYHVHHHENKYLRRRSKKGLSLICWLFNLISIV